MDYVFGTTAREVGVGVLRHSCEEFRTALDNCEVHFRFSNLVYRKLKLFAEKEGFRCDIVAYERNCHGAHFIMTSRLYCQLLPSLQDFFLGCVKEFKKVEVARTVEDI